MKAIVVGSGAGGATAARELQSSGFEVLILDWKLDPLSNHSPDTYPGLNLFAVSDFLEVEKLLNIFSHQ
ncbi:MAG: NAD(P)-binding protein [Methanobacterium sp.]